MKKINNKWYDDRGNNWNCDEYTEEQADKLSKTLNNCSRCSGCSGCFDCKENPERIVSKPIGSRKKSTTVYFNEEEIQVVCGCFHGTLEEFKNQVEETYPDEKNQYRQEYSAFIEKVEKYRRNE